MIPERKAQLADRQLEWAARKAAGSALKPDDVLLDIEVGNLERFRDSGVDKPIMTPKRWARAIPRTRGLMTITYTRRRLLFLSDGLIINCALVRVHRAEMHGDRRQVFAIARQDRTLAILELGSTRQHNFVDRLLALRDEERARLPAIARQQLEHDDQALQSRSIGELWTLPPQLRPGIASRDDTYSRPKPDLASGPRTTAGMFLRATLRGDQEEVQRLAHELNQGHQGWNDDEPAVIDAACQLAARRFFSEYPHVPVEDFVTDMRDRLSPRTTPPSQHDMEAVIWAALDDGASLPTSIKRADLMRIQAAVTANISGILRLDAAEINSLAAQSEHMATARGYDPPLAKT